MITLLLRIHTNVCAHPVRGEPRIQRHPKRWPQNDSLRNFGQIGFLLKIQLKLMLQQLFTLHWYRRDYSACQHGRQMEFSRGWGNNEFFQGVVENFFLVG